jgi:hypothetical protein
MAVPVAVAQGNSKEKHPYHQRELEDDRFGLLLSRFLQAKHGFVVPLEKVSIPFLKKVE